ncbi:MAG: hypothetical protein M4579_003765 [Chaenotheca gracillima]|nr:MAG: hypothetical protein M4579_003765 [Chaenotheca gracillima]
MAEANGSGGSGAVVRPRVFLDAQIGTEPVGRIVIELFVDKVPKTCENFKALCTTQQSDLSYKLSVFHRVIDEFMIQGGDITKGDGTGGKSIYGEEFEDENLGWHDLDKAGLVCMANRGKDTNNSQFFLSLAPCPHLNGKHTVFGLVVSGQPVLERIAKVKVDKNDRPLDDVLVAHCGELERRKKAAPAAANGRDGHADPTLRDVEKDDKKDERGQTQQTLHLLRPPLLKRTTPSMIHQLMIDTVMTADTGTITVADMIGVYLTTQPVEDGAVPNYVQLRALVRPKSHHEKEEGPALLPAAIIIDIKNTATAAIDPDHDLVPSPITAIDIVDTDLLFLHGKMKS